MRQSKLTDGDGSNVDSNSAAILLSGVCFSYGGKPTLNDVTLSCARGEWLMLTGSNGSGKSTLIKIMNALLVPERGDCYVCGLDTRTSGDEVRRHAATVFQNPESQIIGVTVENDAAFAPENECCPSDEIERRISAALDVVGLLGERKRLVYTLSGGEKQRLVIAGALAQSSDVLLLDEPTAMLDEESRAAVLSLLQKLHAEGRTIVYVTHIADELKYADRVVEIEDGRVSREVSCSDFMPAKDDTCRTARRDRAPRVQSADAKAIEVLNLSHTYSRGTPFERLVFSGVTFTFRKGTSIAVVGRSGSGKSTLVQYLNGLFIAADGCGEVRVDGAPVKKESRLLKRRVGLVFQQPERQLFAQTVREELCYALVNWEIPSELHDGMINDALASVGLNVDMLDRDPLRLSGGEMRRVALASVLVYRPEWLVLDEPTVGLDRASRADLARLIDSLTRAGTGVLFVTHDADFASCADVAYNLSDGKLTEIL